MSFKATLVIQSLCFLSAVSIQALVVSHSLNWYEKDASIRSWKFFATDEKSGTLLIYRQTVLASLLMIPADVYDSQIASSAPWWVVYNKYGLSKQQLSRVVRTAQDDLIAKVRTLQEGSQLLGYVRMSVGFPLRWIHFDLGIIMKPSSAFTLNVQGEVVTDPNDVNRLAEWPSQLKANSVNWILCVVNIAMSHFASFIIVRFVLALCPLRFEH